MLVIVPIMLLSEWNKYFHVHVDASSIALCTLLSHPREGELDHPITFSIRKLSSTKKNYMTT
jgi:hypothetical protein